MKKRDRPAEIEAFLYRWWAERGYGPTLRDIQEGAGISSTSVVTYNLKLLREQGRITFENDRARTARPLQQPNLSSVNGWPR